MNSRLALLRVCAASLLVAAAYAATSAVHAERDVHVYRIEAWEGGPAVTTETTRATLDVVAKRFAHRGLARSKSTIEFKDIDNRLEIDLTAELAEGRAACLRLAERRGLVEFRLRADQATQDEHRDRRLQAGLAPPPGTAWRLPEQGDLQVLVETPEAPLRARIERLRSEESKDDAAPAAELRDVIVALERVLAESVFTNEDIASASVQSVMQRFLRVSVRFEFADARKAAFEKFTGAHIGRAMAVIVDGKVHVTPVINVAIPGMGELRTPGNGYTHEQAQEMAAILESGPLPCRLVEVKDK